MCWRRPAAIPGSKLANFAGAARRAAPNLAGVDTRRAAPWIWNPPGSTPKVNTPAGCRITMTENPYQAEGIETLPAERSPSRPAGLRRVASAALLFAGSFGLTVMLATFALGVYVPGSWIATFGALLSLVAGVWIRR